MTKRKIILGSIIGIVVFLIAIAFWGKKSSVSNTTLESMEIPNSQTATMTTPNVKDSVQSQLEINQVSNNDQCLSLKDENSLYRTIEKVKSTKKFQSRFMNIHLKQEGTVYRLRRFFKDGQEGEKEKFLVLEEINSDDAQLKESSDYKPGMLYQKLLNAKAEVIFQEEGLQNQEGLFLHYVDGKLQAIQGRVENRNVDCIMSP